MPNEDSKNSSEIHTPQRTKGIGPVRASQPIVKQDTETNPNPRYQAIFFGLASTHSGRWGLTIREPRNIEGEYLALKKSLTNMSSMNKAPKALSGP
jgi:hypothetical protein